VLRIKNKKVLNVEFDPMLSSGLSVSNLKYLNSITTRNKAGNGTKNSTRDEKDNYFNNDLMGVE